MAGTSSTQNQGSKELWGTDILYKHPGTYFLLCYILL